MFDLLTAFAHLYAVVPDARLNVIGSGPLDAQLRRRTEELNIDQATTFFGRKSIDEFSATLLESSALVLPSHSEPWGLTVNEALSYGCPAIVSDVCGCVPDLVLDGHTGYAFPAGDVQALTAAMHAVLKMNRLDIARNCLAVIAKFTPDRAATQILDGCERLVSGAA